MYFYAENSVIGPNARVGDRPEDLGEDGLKEWGVAVVGADTVVAEGAVIGPKAMVKADVKGGEVK